MPFHLKRFFICILIIVSVNAQSGELFFEQISLEEGLPHINVFDITQDATGFLWIATQDGLSRYDGYQITTFKANSHSSNSISINTVSTVRSDKNGNLWIGTWGGGVNYIDTKTGKITVYKNIPGDDSSLPFDRAPVILIDSKRRVWIGTAGGGLALFEPGSGKFIRFSHKPDDPLSLSNDRVWAITEDRSGLIWIGTDQGLNSFNPEKKVFRRYMPGKNGAAMLPGDVIRALCFDREGYLWAGSDKGLSRFNPSTGEYIIYRNKRGDKNSLAGNIINTICETPKGDMAIGTLGSGLSFWRRKTDRFENYYNDPLNINSLSYNDVRTIFYDASGVLWVGTRGGGISKFSESFSRFSSLRFDPLTKTGLNSNNIRAVFADSRNIIWIGTNDRGLNSYNPSSGKFRFFMADSDNQASISDNQISSVSEDDKGNLWVGTYRGLNYITPDGVALKRFFRTGSKTGLTNDVIIAVQVDKSGKVWAGTYGGGLNVYDPRSQTFRVFRKNDASGLSNDEISSIYLDGGGNIWVGTMYGLNLYDPATDKFKVFINQGSNGNKASANIIWDIKMAGDGLLWLATNEGLHSLDPASGTFRSYTVNEGLPSDVVYTLQITKNGDLWLGTSNGVSQFSPKTRKFVNYNKSDGLSSNLFTKSATDAQGIIYFGSIKGVNFINPAAITSSGLKPAVMITGFTLIEESLSKVKKTFFNESPLSGFEPGIELSSDQNFFRIDFASLDYTNPSKNRFRYQLEGFDNGWINSGNRNYAVYTNVSPGSYRFLIQGTNSDGEWSDKIAVLTLVINPPIYRTVWFYLFAGVALITIGFLTYKSRIRFLIKKQSELLDLISGKEIAEQELKESRERYELAVKGSTDGIWDINLENNQLFMSQGFNDMIGYTDSTFIMSLEFFKMITHPEDTEAAFGGLEKAISTNSHYDAEFRLRCADGSYKWFRTRGDITAYKNGKPSRISGSISDVSVRKRDQLFNSVLYRIAREANTSQKLENLMEKIHSAINSIAEIPNICIFTIDPETGKKKILFHKDIKNGTLSRSFLMDERFTFPATGESDKLTVRRGGSSDAVTESNPLRTWVILPLIKDGVSYGTVCLYSYDEAPQLDILTDQMLEMLAEQISTAIDKKREEDLLKRNQEIFNIINEGVNDLISIIDPGGNIVFASNSFKKIFGISGHFNGKIPMRFIHPEDREKVQESFRRVIERKEYYKIEFRYITPGREILYIESEGNIITDTNGDPELVLVVSRNITDRKIAENKIRDINKELEGMVEQRTAQLLEINQNLNEEIAIRTKVENMQNALYKISESIHMSKNENELYRHLHEIIRNLIPVDNFYITGYTPDSEIHPVLFFNKRQITPVDDFSRIMPYVNRTFSTASSVRGFLSPLTILPESTAEQNKNNNFIAIPLMINNAPVGSMVIHDSKGIVNYDNSMADILNYLADQIATAISIKRNEDSEKRRNEMIIRFRGILFELSQSDNSNFRSTVHRIIKKAGDVLRFDRAGYWIISLETQTMVCHACYDRNILKIDERHTGTTIPVEFPDIAPNPAAYLGEIFKRKFFELPDKIQNRDSEIYSIYIKPNQIQGMWDFPVWYQGKVVGILRFENFTPFRKFIIEEEEFIVSLCSLISLSVEAVSRKNAVDALLKSEEQYRTVVENASEGIIIVQDGRLKFVNPKMLELSGFSEDEAARLQVNDLFSNEIDSVTGVLLPFNPESLTDAKNLTLRINTRDNSEKIAGVNSVKISWKNKDAVLIFLTDITERRRAEAEIRKNLEIEREFTELRSRFISMASHELRTPLTSILASAEILAKYGEKLTEDKKKKSIARIQNNAKEMSHLINDVLFIQKTDAGKLEIKKEPVNLLSLCKSSVELIETGSALKTGHIIYFSPSDINRNFNLDPVLIKQIIENLLSNAVKYSPPGSEIHFTVTGAGGSVFISVKDNGIGIPEDDLPKLFQPFHRAKNVGNISGTGLGLSIVKRAVSLHDGKIEIKTAVNSGCEFIIEIPDR